MHTPRVVFFESKARRVELSELNDRGATQESGKSAAPHSLLVRRTHAQIRTPYPCVACGLPVRCTREPLIKSEKPTKKFFFVWVFRPQACQEMGNPALLPFGGVVPQSRISIRSLATFCHRIQRTWIVGPRLESALPWRNTPSGEASRLSMDFLRSAPQKKLQETH